MLFSIIISTYNRSTYLPELLISLQAQTYKDPIEVIIIEAGNFTSLEKIKKICRRHFPDCRVLHAPDISLGAARNRGALTASGKWCVFSDDDDVWHPEKLSVLADHVANYDLISHSYISSAQPSHVDFNKCSPRGKAIFGTLASLSEHFWGNRFGGGSSICCRHSLIETITFNERMRSAEDIEWIIRCVLAEVRIGYINLPLVCYRVHGQRMTSSINKNIRWDIYFAKKYFMIAAALYLGSLIKVARVILRLSLRR